MPTVEIKMNPHRVTPKVDLAFKKIFGVEENKDLLISLINSIVSEKDQIADLTLLNPYNPQNFPNDKLSILDIKAKGTDGHLFNVEIQLADESNYENRALYYWGKVYTEQLKSGQNYSKLKKTIGIHILNFVTVPESQEYHNIFHIVEQKKGFKFFHNFEIHTIELTKFSHDMEEDLNDLLKRIKSSIDMWMAFLTRNDLLDQSSLPETLSDENLKKALNVLDVINFSEEERDLYEGRLKWIRMEESAMLKKFEDGLKQGIEQGITQGIEQGITQGIEQGITHGIENTALNMLKQNLEIDIISSVTGLPIEKIHLLKKQL